MEFEFDKFVKDIEKRNIDETKRKSNRKEEIDLDEMRRLEQDNITKDGKIELFGRTSNEL